MRRRNNNIDEQQRTWLGGIDITGGMINVVARFELGALTFEPLQIASEFFHFYEFIDGPALRECRSPMPLRIRVRERSTKGETCSP